MQEGKQYEHIYFNVNEYKNIQRPHHETDYYYSYYYGLMNLDACILEQLNISNRKMYLYLHLKLGLQIPIF